MTTPSVPPRTAERLLDALGAEPEFRDALLGDLAEEYAIRHACDGPRAALRWYWREALRVAPYLLCDWARRLRPRDVARLVRHVIAAYAMVFIVAFVVMVTVEVVVEAVRGQTTFFWHDEHPGALSLSLTLLLVVALAMAGGWLASWLEGRAPEVRAPAVAALTLGVAWAAYSLVDPLPKRPPLPELYVLSQAVAVLAGTTLGGALRIATRRLPQACT
jgi:hypothetical protein